MNIGASGEIILLKTGARAGAGASRGLAERLFQNILKTAKTAAASPRRAGKALRTKVEAFKVRVGTVSAITCSRPGAAAETLKATEAGFSLRVDLATIEGFTFVLVAQKFVCGIQLGKARRRFGVILIGVWVQFFC